MTRFPRIHRTWPMAVLALALGGAASAQTGGSSTTGPAQTPGANTSPTPGNAYPAGRGMYGWSEGNYSLIPYSTHGYIGFNAGTTDWDAPCGTGGFACDDSNSAFHLYTGGMFNQYIGAEIGLIDFGRADRGGGRVKAHGLNLSLVGRIPMGRLSVFGKFGTLYGRTDSEVLPGSGLTAGKDSGWEGSYGVGVGFDFTPRSSIVLEWNRFDLNFEGVGQRNITTTSLGYVHRF